MSWEYEIALNWNLVLKIEKEKKYYKIQSKIYK
jgi:hypothetical protein